MNVRIGFIRWVFPLFALPVLLGSVNAAEQPKESDADFFKSHCIRCHGPQKSKAGVTLHDLAAEVSNAAEAERWTRVLGMLQKGEMPPEDEVQPAAADKAALVKSIRSNLKAFEERERAAKAGNSLESRTTTRRLTNFEYQNTMRDLLGIDLQFADRLPKDPVKPYHFNNTSSLMLMGPEQLDAYLENARRAMASVIVDPDQPKARKTRMDWKATSEGDRLPNRELSIWPGGRGNVSIGMGIKDFPKTGEFRVRFQASAFLPQGVQEVPLRLVMGQPINTLNIATLIMVPVGTVRVRNGPEAPQVFEFRGRIENFTPFKSRNKAGEALPETLTITPQNLYDDGSLNDDNAFTKTRHLTMPRVAIDWMEFESPVADTWPPEHHSRILFDSPLKVTDPDAYVRAVLKKFMTRAYRRLTTEDEVNRVAKIYAILRPELKTMEAAMRETLALVLASPQFLFHTVTERTGQDDRQYELASRLSYFLWASCPEPNCGRIRCRVKAVGIGLRFMVDSRIVANSGEGCGAATRPSCVDSEHAHAMVLAI